MFSFPGKSTDELINVWRKEAEAVLTARYKEGTSIELYKVVAERKVGFCSSQYLAS